jgi:hypothetical protein
LERDVREKVSRAVTPLYKKAIADAGLDVNEMRASVVQLIKELCEITEGDATQTATTQRSR